MLHGGGELGAFALGELAHELFFGEKVVEGGEPPMPLAARLVAKARALHRVLRQLHAVAAGYAAQALAELARGVRAGAAFVDQLKERHRAVGREHGAFELLKPDRAAIHANVDFDFAVVMPR